MNLTDGPKGGVTQLLRAIHFAAEQHRDHRRKGKTGAPYINHPITVAEQLSRAGEQDNIDLLMAAVLHDVIEDTETTQEEMEALFGKSVTAIVMEVTDDKSLDEKERKRLVVQQIAGKSREARLLKLSDMIANIYDVIHHPPNWSRDRKHRYFDWCEQVAREIEGIHPALERQFRILIGDGRRKLGG